MSRCTVERVASVFLFEGVFVVDSHMIYGLSCRDPDGFHDALNEPADEALGAAIQSALTHSRALTASEAELLLPRSVTNQSYETWVRQFLDRTGVRSRRRLFDGLATCSVVLRDGWLTISALRRDRGEGFEGIGAEKDIHLTEAATTKEIGAAIRRGLALARD